jgi:periplasmic protein CpxP/Spy
MGRGHGRHYGEYGRQGRGRDFERGPRDHGRHGGPGFGRMGAADPAELESIKKEIGVTAEQEQAWTTYAAAVKEAADSAKTRRDGVDRNAIREMSRDERRAFMDSMRDQRRKEVDAVTDAAAELVKSLDEKQAAVAKEILPGHATRYGQRGAGMHRDRGGRHDRHHRHDER